MARERVLKRKKEGERQRGKKLTGEREREEARKRIMGLPCPEASCGVFVSLD